MRTFLLSFVGVCLLVCLSACTGHDLKDVHGNKFTGAAYDIRVPDGWLTNVVSWGLDLFIVADPAGALDDDFSENVNVVLENIPSSISEEQYLDLTRENLKGALGADIIEEGPYDLGGTRRLVCDIPLTWDRTTLIMTLWCWLRAMPLTFLP